MVAEATEGQHLLSLGDLLRVVRTRLWVILLIAIVCMGAAVGFSLAQTPVYEASIKVLVGQGRGIITENPNEVQGLQQLTQTMAEGVRSRLVAEAVIQQLNLRVTPEEFLESRLSAQQIKETQFVQVNYRDSSPERAQQVANTIGEVFSQRVSQLDPSNNPISATVWEQAPVPSEPVSPTPVRNGLLALVLGAMLGTGLAFLLGQLDDSWQSSEEAEQVTGVPTFGLIPQFDLAKGKRGRM
jgi:capsular polysaccharide biosynthesis protein